MTKTSDRMIQVLTEENERLRQENENLARANDMSIEEITRLQGEIERLEKLRKFGG